MVSKIRRQIPMKSQRFRKWPVGFKMNWNLSGSAGAKADFKVSAFAPPRRLLFLALDVQQPKGWKKWDPEVSKLLAPPKIGGSSLGIAAAEPSGGSSVCSWVGDTWSQQWWGFFANIANLGMALTLHGWYVVHPCASCRFKLWYTSIHSRDLNGIWPYEWLWKHLLGLTTIQHLFQLSGFWGLGGIVQMYWLHVFCTWLLLHLQCLRSCCCHCC